MKSKPGIIIATALIFIIAATVLIIWGGGVGNRNEPPEQTKEPAAVASVTPEKTPEASLTPEPTAAPEPVINKARLAVAGDIVMHPGLSSEAENDGAYDYSSVFGGAAGYLRSADYAVATLKGTFPGETTYTGYPLIKAPDAMAGALREIGIDLVSTASRNSFDSSLAGLQRTMDVLEGEGILTVGTNRTQEELDRKRGIRIVSVNDINIAFVAYTCVTGDVSFSSNPYAVNLIYDEDSGVYDFDRIEKDMDHAHDLGADLTVVFIQWGREYYTSASDEQKEVADFLFLQGADVIIGGHAYVPQPMETRQVTDKRGISKTGYICYCLGNLVSCLTDENTNLTAIVNIEIEKNMDTGTAAISVVSYVPMFMVDLNAYNITGSSWRYRLWDVRTAINSYESGNDLGVINDTLYEALLKGLSDIHAIFGEDLDGYK